MTRKRNLIAGQSNTWHCVGIEVITFILVVALSSGIGLAQGNGGGNGNGGGGNGGGGGGNAPNPTNLTATAVSGSRILLDWTSGGGETAGFIVCYLENSTPRKRCSNGTQIDAGTATSAEIVNLDRNSYYGIRVCAYNASGSVSSGITTSSTTLDLPDFVETQIVTDFPGHNTTDAHRAILLQPDGKVLAAGLANIDTNFQVDQDFLVVRYNEDGRLDTSFGDNGTTRIDFIGGRDQPNSMVAEPTSGKILVGGVANVTIAEGLSYGAVARLNADGSLDGSFGTGGQVTIDALDDTEHAYVFGLDNEKVLVVGEGTNGAGDEDIYIGLLNSDGSIDTNFGIAGFAITDIDNGSVDLVNDAAMQADGKLIVAGSVNGIAAVSRFDVNGMLDLTFGDLGTRIVDLADGGTSSYASLAIDSFGNVIAVGSSYVGGGDGTCNHNTDSDCEAVVTRLDANGTMDDNFGVFGNVRMNPGPELDIAKKIAFDGSQLVIIGSFLDVTGPSAYEGTITRLNANGSVDSSFANGMYFFNYTQDGPDWADRFHDLVIDSLGRYVVVGSVHPDSSPKNSLLMRFYP